MRSYIECLRLVENALKNIEIWKYQNIDYIIVRVLDKSEVELYRKDILTDLMT